jgi:enamine deaminase RidA (YjgF/YER057c/UK114 family)
VSQRIDIFSGAHWENSVGYWRTVRMGIVVEVKALIKPELLVEIEVTAYNKPIVEMICGS